MPVVTLLIILSTVLVSIAAMQRSDWFDRLKFNAWDIRHRNQYYRFLTFGWVHAGYFHLLVNMFVLWSFGSVVERYFGILFPDKSSWYFILMYAGGLVFPVLPSFQKHRNDVFYNSVGASGAVSAVVFSAILLNPEGKIFLYLIPVPVPAPLDGLLYLGYEYYMSKKGNDNIGHDAHFWGALFGLLFTVALRPSLVPEFISKIIPG